MHISGQRIKRTRLVQTEKYVVAVEVKMVIPVDAPSEPCYESETVQLLREIKEHAEQGMTPAPGGGRSEQTRWLTEEARRMH